MKNLAYIGKIIKINPIKDADKIVQAEVVCGQGGKWCGVVSKEMNLGQLVEVYLPDAIVPEVERFEFMRKRKFRVTMCRFKGVASEVLIMPIGDDLCDDLTIGDDIGDFMKVIKFEKPIDPSIAGDALGSFPGFMPKTDEPNFQTASHLVDALKGKKFYASVKADGSSGTMAKYKGQFHCCSRNLSMKDTPHNLIWLLARKYDLINNLPEGFAIQFEMVGPSIQGNPMGLPEKDLRIFNLYNIEEQKYCGAKDLEMFCCSHGVPMVEIDTSNMTFPTDVTNEWLQTCARGNYSNGKPREGLVFRPIEEETVMGERLSFKVINLEYGK
jgi:RNA ligase (TIGR02306 family)